MKKSFFGYDVSEVDVMLSALREENESLNATIITLKTQMKNGGYGNSARINLLETELRSNEEELILLREEKRELLAQVSSLSREINTLQQQNAELQSYRKQFFVPDLLQAQLAAGRELQPVAAFEEGWGPNEFGESSIPDEELSAVRATSQEESDELPVLPDPSPDKSFRQSVNINRASEISNQAYYEMSRMRNEAVEYMRQQMKEYYQLLNDHSLRLHSALEQRQQEYSQMIRDFFNQTSEFRTRLSDIEAECHSMVDFNRKVDPISIRMKEIMDHFMEECDAASLSS